MYNIDIIDIRKLEGAICMSGNLVITIGRQCGSSGKVIGQKLAEELGIKCYDKELLTLAAKNSGICEELFKTHDERPTNSFLYSLVMDSYSMGYTTSGYMDMPINHKIFLAQFDTIKQLADQESCVIVGRCADYALADYPNVVTTFITADDKDRINSLKELYEVDDAKAKDIMIKTDKKRISYYNYYSNKKWGDIKSYDLCLNRSAVGIDGAVKIIRAFAEAKVAWNKANR
jgi:cytidylate kinase